MTILKTIFSTYDSGEEKGNIQRILPQVPELDRLYAEGKSQQVVTNTVETWTCEVGINGSNDGDAVRVDANDSGGSNTDGLRPDGDGYAIVDNTDSVSNRWRYMLMLVL